MEEKDKNVMKRLATKLMPKHTPGPWRVEFSRPCSWLIRSDGVHLPGDYDVGKVNACLIAAAPDLLDALLELHAACEYWEDQEDPVLASARAAIAKATGA